VGALTLGAVYLIFALLWMPHILAEPLVYDRWGNFFEQLSQVSGALIVYALFGRSDSEYFPKLARIGYKCFGVCVVCFMLEQLFYLSGTAEFVPKWISPGQMFWATTTTIAFALTAIALLSGHSALLASRLLTAMIVGFGLLVWLPAPFADPNKLTNWAGNAQNLSIAGAAWIVSDFLSQNRSISMISLRTGFSRPSSDCLALQNNAHRHARSVPLNAPGSRKAIGRISAALHLSERSPPSPASVPETCCGLANPDSER
jgi:hypothetical protein